MKSERSRGFTVLEAIVASASMGVVLMASMSLIALSARAGPEAAAQAGAIRDGRGFRLMDDDLAAATWVQTVSATEVKFEVPDRTGDGVADVVRYWWPGAGQGLHREVNGVGAAELTRPWSSLVFSGTWADRWTTGTGASALSSSTQRLAVCVPSASVLTEYPLGYSSPVALTVRPRLPSTATHWKVDTLVLTAKASGGMRGSWTATLRADALLLPFATPAWATSSSATTQTVGQKFIVTFTFSNAPELSAAQTATFDIRTSLVSGSLTVYGMGSGAGDSRQWLHTGAGAITPLASLKPDASLEHLVTGRIRTPSLSAQASSRLTNVGVAATYPNGDTVGYVVGAIGEPDNR